MNYGKFGCEKGIMMPFLTMDKCICYVQRNIHFGLQSQAMEKRTTTTMLFALNLGQVQMPYFTWAESNANEVEQRIFLICIRFGSYEVQVWTWP